MYANKKEHFERVLFFVKISNLKEKLHFIDFHHQS